MVTVIIWESFLGLWQSWKFSSSLELQIEAGDTILGEHLSTAAQNVTLFQIIDVLADQVRQNIIQKVQAAKWYTVIADEVTDLSNKEQLSVVLRYVDSVSWEDLVGFTECDTGISGQNLAEKIMTYLEALGLDLSNLHGQGYSQQRGWCN